MRVAFTGASGTGKTSCADAVFSRLEAMRPLGSPPIARLSVDGREMLEVLAQRSVDGAVPELRVAFQLLYVGAKIQLERQSSSFLVDRSFGDVLAYWRVHCEHVVSGSLNQRISRFCLDRVQLYDIHLFFPVGLVPFEPDGYRNTEVEYHLHFESVLLDVYREAGVDPVAVPAGSIHRRADWVVDRLTGVYD